MQKCITKNKIYNYIIHIIKFTLFMSNCLGMYCMNRVLSPSMPGAAVVRPPVGGPTAALHSAKPMLISVVNGSFLPDYYK